jgi:hypothetical protein
LTIAFFFSVFDPTFALDTTAFLLIEPFLATFDRILLDFLLETFFFLIALDLWTLGTFFSSTF